MITPPQSIPGPEASGYSWRDFLHTLRRWWLPAGLAGLLLAAVGMIAAYYISGKTYEATAMLQVSSQDQHLVFEKQQQYTDPFVPTQIELIRSPLIISQVLDLPRVARLPEVAQKEYPDKWLRSTLQVERLGQSELLEIKLKSADPETAATIVNAIVDTYSKFHGDEKARRSERMIELLKSEQEQRKRELDRLRADVKHMVEQDPSLLELQRTNVIAGAPDNTVAERLAATQAELHVQRARVRALEETIEESSQSVDQRAVEAELDQHPAVTRLNETIAEKQALIARTKAVAAGGSRSMAVRELESELAVLDEERVALLNRLRAEIERQLIAEHRAAMAAQVREAQVELRGLEAMEKQLASRYERSDVEQAAGGLAMEFLFKHTELERAEMVYKQVSDRADELQTEVHAPARVTTLLAAEAPAPVESKRLIAMGLGGGMGFLLPFGLAVLLEKLRQPVRNAEQMTREGGVPVIGELTYCPERKLLHDSRRRHGNDRQRLLYDESIDALRTRLLLGGPLANCQIVVVASAASGEGKTRLASQLAASMARASGEPTLLIDADARSPSIHGMFNLANEAGLVEVLEGTATLQEALVTNWSPALHLLTAGRLIHNPHAVFHPEKLEAVWRELRAEYRHIVVDTPPILSAAEALTMAKHADGVLVCALSEVSRSRRVESALEQLKAVGANVIGLVINGVPASDYENRYGSYHYADRYPDMGVAPTPRDAKQPLSST